jgi:hypothetical protein
VGRFPTNCRVIFKELGGGYAEASPQPENVIGGEEQFELPTALSKTRNVRPAMKPKLVFRLKPVVKIDGKIYAWRLFLHSDRL